jgi:hypothetical protein
MQNEESYYPEIQTFIEAQLKSNFLVNHHRELHVSWGIGELKTNLRRIILDAPALYSCAEQFSELVPPLNLDIFALISDGLKFQLLVLEIKLVKSAGLKEWSQLVGYCLVAGAKYGLLVNIDNGGSARLTQILHSEPHLSHIQTVMNGEIREHNLGLMQWNSSTKNFEYSSYGAVKSLSGLCEMLSSDFS